MQLKTFLGTVCLAGCALAHPVADKRAAVTDLDILQYALTLEHLENVFYKGAIEQFPESDFVAAGFTADYYSALKYVVHDEEAHVIALTAAIKMAGATPVAACTYDFPYTDVKSFVALASVLEGVGTSAYLGGAGLISSKEYLGVAGSILVTESLHTSIQRFNLGQVPAANPYGTALGLNEVFTLAASFIKSCPSSNPALPVKPFPGLTATQGEPTSEGIPFTFTAAGDVPAGSFVTYASGLAVTSVALTMDGGMISAVVPDTAMGQSYAFITNANITALTDAAILFGPAIVEVTPPAPTFDFGES